jgi:small-conductance mechanosensitive channel
MWETQIKQALLAAGLDEALASRITVKSESEIANAIKKLQRELETEKITKALEGAGLKDSFEKVLQSLVDQRVTQALNTRDEKAKKDAEDAEAKKKAEADKSKKTEGMSDEQKLVSELRDALKQMQDEIQAIKSESEKAGRESQIKKALKDAGLKEDFAKYVTGTDETAIKEQIEGLKSDFLAAKQDENNRLLDDGKPVLGGAGATATEAAVASFAKGRIVPGAGGGGLASQQITKK